METSDILNAIPGILWPILATIILALLFPTIKRTLAKRGFTIKFGPSGVELSVQEANDQLRATLTDLQDKVEELRTATNLTAEPATTFATPDQSVPRRIVWVDDNPSNNAFMLARLRDEGVEVIEHSSTQQAIRSLIERRESVRAVISDMVRREGGNMNEKAGIELIKRLRAAGINVPIFVYCSPRAVSGIKDMVLSAGGSATTGSPTELYELLKEPLS